jgi:hypothetical protein
MIHSKLRNWRFRALMAAMVLPLAALAGGCATVYYGQVAVPDTKQRLVAGQGEGFWSADKRLWVIEDGKVEDVNIVEENK